MNWFQVNFRCHCEARGLAVLAVQMRCLISTSQEYPVGVIVSYS